MEDKKELPDNTLVGIVSFESCQDMWDYRQVKLAEDKKV